jgi:F-type H+-transporting ATPase subunit a
VHGVKGWLGHFFKPFKLYVFFNVLELFTRPLTLALRLFGNIYAGEVMLKTLYRSLGSSLLAPVLWLAFSVFIGVLQAYVFTALSMAYTGSAMQE